MSKFLLNVFVSSLLFEVSLSSSEVSLSSSEVVEVLLSSSSSSYSSSIFS